MYSGHALVNSFLFSMIHHLLLILMLYKNLYAHTLLYAYFIFE